MWLFKGDNVYIFYDNGTFNDTFPPKKKKN